MNIIFDLGGVVFNWNPQNLLNNLTDNSKEKELLTKHLFNNREWIDLDQGIIKTEEVIENTAIRSGLSRSLISSVFKSVPNELKLKVETKSIIEELKRLDVNLYVLSNMHKDFAKSLLENYNFWNNFKGIVFSCDVKMVKPNRDIYEFILNKYSLKPNETLFIDDTKINVDIAKGFGIGTIHFKNPDQLRSELIKLKII